MGIIERGGEPVATKTEIKKAERQTSLMLREIASRMKPDQKDQADVLRAAAKEIEKLESQIDEAATVTGRLKDELTKARVTGNDGSAGIIKDLEAQLALQREQMTDRFTERLLTFAVMNDGNIHLDRKTAERIANIN